VKTKEEIFEKIKNKSFLLLDENNQKEVLDFIKNNQTKEIFLIPKKIKPFNKEYRNFLRNFIEEARKYNKKVFYVKLPPCIFPITDKFDSFSLNNGYFSFYSEEGKKEISFNKKNCIFKTKGLCDGIFCSEWKIEKENLKVEKVNNYYIVYSPDKIGFAVFDEKEYKEFKKLIDEYNKEYNFYYFFLWKRGLIKINNTPIITDHFIEKMKEVDPVIVEIELSNSCNLACKYCYVSAGKDKVISWETLKKIIEKVIKEFPSKEIAIQLGGGEALLFMDLIEKAVNYGKILASKLNKKVSFMIQSNGLLLGKYAEKLKELNISVGISFDGPFQDINRPLPNGKGSRELLLKSIKEARKKGIPVEGAISVVIKPEQMFPIYEDLKANGFKRIKFLYYFKAGRGKQYGIEEMNEKEQLEFAEKEFELFKKSLEDNIYLTETITKIMNLLSRKRPEVCSKTPCGAGRNFFVFDREGNIYPCYHFIKLSKFKMGNLNSKFEEIINSDIKKELDKRHVNNLEDCKSCPIKYYCSSGCTSHAYYHYGKIQAKSPYCLYYKAIYKKLMIWLKENALIF
jgi:uncharacterized protein